MAISWSVISLRLPSKVPFAIIGDEKCPDGSVWIERAEVALAPVEAAELAIWPARFEDWPSHRRVPQFLRQPQIFRLANVAEFRPVFSIMFIELRPAAEPGSAGEKQQRDEYKPD
jgi:hypothetical protein